MILASDPKGNDITVEQVRTWLNNREKKKLADFFYNRFYGRYLRPFDYPANDYKKKYKNGFAIMTNCCLLIETFVSWTEPTFANTRGNSERCIGYFFMTQERFKEFSIDGLSKNEYLNIKGKPKPKLNHKGIPCDFYHNVRCSLLHNGETKNNWKISRKGEILDLSTKMINSIKFMNRLKSTMIDFRQILMDSDFDNGSAWKAYKIKLQELLVNAN